MNIIISSTGTDGVRFVNYDSSSSYDINKIKLFISKTLNLTPTVLELHYNDPAILDQIENTPTYTLLVKKNIALEKNNQDCYELHSDFAIASQVYDAVLKLGSYTLEFTTPLQVFNKLEDEHEPIVINDRTISKISTIVVAEDYSSQQFKFLIKERYDGVSILDNNKQIYADYIPVDFEPFIDPLDSSNMINFLSDEITEKNVIILNNENWVELRWNLPAAAMKKAGVVKFAISVISIEEPLYTWQTLPSTFIISSNLAKRPKIPMLPSDSESTPEEDTNADMNEALTRISALEDFVNNIDNVSSIDSEKGTITYTSRDNATETVETYSLLSITNTSDDGQPNDAVIMNGGSSGGGE